MARKPIRGRGSDRDGAKTEARRFEPYGVREEQAYDEDIVVPPGKLLHLSAEALRRQRGFHELRPKSIDDVKRWIGVPDAVGQQRGCAHPCPDNLTLIQDASEVRNLKPTQRKSLHALGQAYVHGDSRVVAQHRSLLDLLLVDAVINGFLVRGDIDVYGVLEISASIRILFARDVRIWGNGKIRFLGDGKIDCRSIEGKRIVRVPDLVHRLPRIGILRELEAGYA